MRREAPRTDRANRLAAGLAGLLVTIAGGAAATPARAAGSGVVDTIRQRGELVGGVGTGAAIGMSTLDSQGQWHGLEVDFCHAVAAAITGDAAKVNFVPLVFKNAFAALRAGSIDELGSGASWTFTRNADLHFDWPVVYVYDGEGFLVRKSLGVKNVAGLNGATICVTGGSDTELNLADYFRSHGWSYTPLVTNSREQNLADLQAGRCDAYTNERGALAANRSALPKPGDYVVLPDVISKEPTGPVIRDNDPQFRHVVMWTFFAMVTAEEYGVTRANVGKVAATTKNPALQRLFGRTGGFGAMLGLPNDWAVKVIAAEGNYGELYDRNLGKDSRIGLARGPNALWKDGGLVYAPPVR